MTYHLNPVEEIYYRKGRMHREGDLPAYYSKYNHVREWRVHGQLHREGGRPAVDGLIRREWWRHGQLHRDGDKPAIRVRVLKTASDFTYVTCYFQHGVYHREGDKPAVVADSFKMWFRRGVLHRDGKPAIVRSVVPIPWMTTTGPVDSNFWRNPFSDERFLYATEVWAIDGVVARGNDKPAVTIIEYTHALEWYIDGKLGRSGDKPARVTTHKGRSEPFERLEWYIDGKLGRSGDMPARVCTDKYRTTHEWYIDGELGRSGDMPARVAIGDGRTKKLEWHARGKLHRDGDQPAYVDVLVGEAHWYQHGARHRDNGLPAVVGMPGNFFASIISKRPDPELYLGPTLRWDAYRYTPTGTVTCWYQHDELHRDDDLPAVVCGDYALWFRHGQLQRAQPDDALVQHLEYVDETRPMYRVLNLDPVLYPGDELDHDDGI